MSDPERAEQTGEAGLFETAADPNVLDRAVAAAAPVVAERADLAMLRSLEPALREPMLALLSSLADNKYLLGRRYAEWCTGAPMLESAVAAAAMAQDELGHARSPYPLLRAFRALEAPLIEDRGWQHRPTSAMTCLGRPFGRWSDFVAANLLVDTALTTLLAAAVDSPYEPLRQRARKMLQEESGHWVLAVGWMRRMQSDESEIADALERVWDDAFTWFAQPDDPVDSATQGWPPQRRPRWAAYAAAGQSGSTAPAALGITLRARTPLGPLERDHKNPRRGATLRTRAPGTCAGRGRPCRRREATEAR